MQTAEEYADEALSKADASPHEPFTRDEIIKAYKRYGPKETKHGDTMVTGRSKVELTVRDGCTTVSSRHTKCKHINGWYRTIPARWFGRRSVFVCTDCGNVLGVKTKKKV